MVWNLVISAGPGFFKVFLFEFSIFDIDEPFGRSCSVFLVVACLYVGACLSYPILGMLGDVLVGRYRVIHCSLLVSFLGALLLSLFFMWMYWIDTNVFAGTMHSVLFVLLFVICIVGHAGFQANVVQFGADQMHEAPSGEWSAMVRWFVWSSVLGKELSEAVFVCILICNPRIKSNSKEFSVYTAALCAANAVMLQVTILCKKKLFASVPRFPNPYKTTLSILNFVRKHKYPVRQSALFGKATSRIDYAKQKFGGPFTSDAVEDFKSLLRIVPVILAMGSFFLVRVAAEYTHILFSAHINLKLANDISGMDDACTVHNDFLTGRVVVSLTAVLMGIVYELVLHPLFGTYFPNILRSFGMGMALLIASTVMLLIVDTSGHAANHQIKCMFWMNATWRHKAASGNVSDLELATPFPGIIVIIHFMNLLSFVLIGNSALKFILAQSPQATKGMLIGLLSLIESINTLFGSFIIQVFYTAFEKPKVTYPSCGFGYYLVNAVIAIAAFVLFCYVARKYKYRERVEEESEEKSYQQAQIQP